MKAKLSVGVIGLGLMGAAFSARLIEAGITVVGFDVDTNSCRALKAQGGELALSAADMAARCHTVVVAVYSADQAEALLAEIAGSVEIGCTTMICTTTCAPSEIMRIAKRALGAGLSLIEAPFSGTSAQVRDGSAMALIAGELGAIEAAGTILDILCPQRIRVGKIGDAARTKLAINLILQNNRAALAEGIAFAESLGLDAAEFLDTARSSAAYSRVMDTKGQKMLASDFTPQSRISQTLKDAELILNEAKRRYLPLPMTSTQTALLRTAVALMGPDCDSAAIIEVLRPSRTRTGNAT